MKIFKFLSLLITTIFISVQSFAKQPIKNEKAKTGVFYQIQLIQLPETAQKKFETVDYYKKAGETVYNLGVFQNYKHAKLALKELKEEGIGQGIVVAFFNKSEIELEDAMLLSNNQTKHESDFSINGENISTEQLNKMLFENAGSIQVTYKIHTGLFVESKVLPDFGGGIAVEEVENENGFYTYQIGEFRSKVDAIAFRKKMITSSVTSEAIVVPYAGEKRISLLLAETLTNLQESDLASLED